MQSSINAAEMKIRDIFLGFKHDTAKSLLIAISSLSFRALPMRYYRLQAQRIDSYSGPLLHADTVYQSCMSTSSGVHLAQIVVPTVLIRDIGQWYSCTVELYTCKHNNRVSGRERP